MPLVPTLQRVRFPVCAALLVAGCTDSGPVDPTDSDVDATNAPVAYDDPALVGPYPVGIRTITLPDVAGYTDVPVEVWYPAAAAGVIPGSYTFIGVSFPAQGSRDVDPDPHAPNLLIAFSHGLGGVRQQNYTMAERLASFGFIVVAPDHTGTTTLEFLASFGDLGPAVVRRPTVIRAAVDALLDGAVPGLTPASDQYGVIGHSLGALTAMTVAGGRLSGPGYEAACAGPDRPSACDLIGELSYDAADVALYAGADDRIVTVILQSPGGVYGFEPGSLATLPRPFIMGATADTVLAYDAETVPVYDALASPAVFATFEDAGHYGYTNMCDLSVATLFAPDCEGAEAGFPDPLVVRAEANRQVVAWMGAELGGVDAFRDDLGVPTDTVGWQEK